MSQSGYMSIQNCNYVKEQTEMRKGISGVACLGLVVEVALGVTLRLNLCAGITAKVVLP